MQVLCIIVPLAAALLLQGCHEAPAASGTPDSSKAGLGNCTVPREPLVPAVRSLLDSLSATGAQVSDIRTGLGQVPDERDVRNRHEIVQYVTAALGNLSELAATLHENAFDKDEYYTSADVVPKVLFCSLFYFPVTGELAGATFATDFFPTEETDKAVSLLVKIKDDLKELQEMILSLLQKSLSPSCAVKLLQASQTINDAYDALLKYRTQFDEAEKQGFLGKCGEGRCEAAALSMLSMLLKNTNCDVMDAVAVGLDGSSRFTPGSMASLLWLASSGIQVATAYDTIASQDACAFQSMLGKSNASMTQVAHRLGEQVLAVYDQATTRQRMDDYLKKTYQKSMKVSDANYVANQYSMSLRNLWPDWAHFVFVMPYDDDALGAIAGKRPKRRRPGAGKAAKAGRQSRGQPPTDADDDDDDYCFVNKPDGYTQATSDAADYSMVAVYFPMESLVCLPFDVPSKTDASCPTDLPNGIRSYWSSIDVSWDSYYPQTEDRCIYRHVLDSNTTFNVWLSYSYNTGDNNELPLQSRLIV
eukprot:TRINITY_DN8177_c0_g1_i1.p1 TRINITY_DN8177_c0_g1~~TRINITY_DN8177_c0_g1_i1.p1  ORF type:complete len:531 (-),score=78.17 TRINITY_DN8177_c0_g1_i1:206-1798(-)